MATGGRDSQLSKRRQLDALDEFLADQPTDDKGGPDGSLGFTFQQWWAAFTIIKLLAGTDEDFAVGLEVKEDVAILDSGSKPTAVEFCQIKKNEQAGAWSVNELYRAGAKGADGTPSLSILAKLYRRRHEFSGHPTKLRFVSNVAFKTPIGEGTVVSSADCKVSSLSDKTISSLKKAIAQQLQVEPDNVKLANFDLHRTSLPLRDQHLMVGGLLGEHCNSPRIPFPLPRPAVAARMLTSEVQDRASNTSYAQTFEDLKERLLTRKEALAILASVSAQAKAPLQDVLDQAISRLNSECHDFLEVNRIRQQRVFICAAAVDRTNMIFKTLVAELTSAKKKLIGPKPVSEKLGTLMNLLLQAHCSKKVASLVELGFAAGVALLVLYEALDVDVYIASVSTESKEEE